MSLERWILDLEGKGSLERPGLLPTELPYRKLGEVLAFLHDARPNPVSRDVLARTLWPTHLKEERLTSVRQALSRLRAILGAEAIWSDRRLCRLEANVQLDIRNHAERATVHNAGEPISNEVVSEEMSLGARVFAMGPRKSFEWLNRNSTAGLGISPLEMQAIVGQWKRRADFAEEETPWLEFWMGVSLVAEDLWKSGARLKRALRLATTHENGEVLSLAAYWLGVSNILIGDFDTARRLATQPREIVARRHRSGIALLESLSAHIDLHQGRTELAIQGLERLAYLEGQSESDRYSTQALRALYLAYDGQIDRAEKTLKTLEPYRNIPGNHLVSSYFNLAEAVIETLDLKGSSLAKAEATADAFDRGCNAQMELYTRELIWLRSAERGKASAARGQMNRIRDLRSSIGLAYTAWDRQRLTPAHFR